MMYVAVSTVTDKYTHTYTHTHKLTTVPLAHAPRVNDIVILCGIYYGLMSGFACPHILLQLKIDGEDYIGSTGNLTFAPQEQRKVVQVPLVDNDLLERKEEVFLIHFTVTSLTPGLLVGTSTVTVTIIDDDCKYVTKCGWP